MNKKLQPTLKRYTNLAATIHILTTKKITLLDPKFWDDGNDKHYLDKYKNNNNLKSLLAICFSQEAETYHHWGVFAPGMDGVCIEFNKEKLLYFFTTGMMFKPIEYLSIKDLKTERPSLEDLPFIKRKPYKPENEFRIVYKSTKKSITIKEISIDLSCIKRIVISPWLPKGLEKSIIKSLKAINPNLVMKIHRSTLVGNDEWMNYPDSL